MENPNESSFVYFSFLAFTIRDYQGYGPQNEFVTRCSQISEQHSALFLHETLYKI